MTTTATRVTLAEQHAAAADLLRAHPDFDLYITTSQSGSVNVQVSQSMGRDEQRRVFGELLGILGAELYDGPPPAGKTDWLQAHGGQIGVVPVQTLYAPLDDPAVTA